MAACGEFDSIDLMADAENGWPLAVMCPRWASYSEIWRSDLRGGCWPICLASTTISGPALA
jgi:hypothetical protein